MSQKKQSSEGRERRGSVLMALLYIALGVFLVLESQAVGTFICYAIGIFLLTFGIIELLMGFRLRTEHSFSVLRMPFGLVLACIGILLVINPEMFQMLLSWMFGGLLLISAIGGFFSAFDLKEYGYSNWWMTLLFSCLKIVGAVILLTHTVGQILFTIAGVFLIIGGVSDLITMFLLGKSKRAFRHSPAVSDEEVETFRTGEIIDAEEGRDFYDADDE